jgi:IrrE N-terminal-like domain
VSVVIRRLRLASLLLLAGCATLTPAQERSADQVRALARQTVRVYGMPDIYLLVTHNPDDPPGSFRRGFFSVSATMLTSSFRDAIAAHELAHYVLGHDAPLREGSDEAQAAEYQQREMDANATAVEILVRAGGMDEARALKAVYEYLAGVEWAHDRYPRMDLRGHRTPCEEIGDLLARFPRQRAWTRALECAPSEIRKG